MFFSYPYYSVWIFQVLYFLNDRLRILYFDDEKDIVTSNMINNYVKNSIVHPPVRKHYKQYHLAFLIVVTILKRCFSLHEISQLIEIQDALVSDTIEKAYDGFSSCFNHYLHEILTYGHVENEWTFKHKTKEKELMVRVVKTVVYKILAELDILEYEEKKGPIESID